MKGIRDQYEYALVLSCVLLGENCNMHGACSFTMLFAALCLIEVVICVVILLGEVC